MANTKYPLSNFPEETDINNITEAMDILTTDLPLIQAYYTALATGNTESINTALNAIPNGQEKLDTAGRFNTLRDAILAVQSYLLDDTGGFKTYISEKQTEWETEVNKFKYIGNYATATTYYKNNIVLYSSTEFSGRELYICTTTNTNISGIIPTNTNHWRKFTMGTVGNSLTYYGEWNSTNTYAISSVVTYENQLYYATILNSNSIPTDLTTWKLLIGRGVSGQLYVQATEPTNPTTNQFWLDTSGN